MSTRLRDLMMSELGALRHEPTEKRIRGDARRETVVDSTRALLVWEPQARRARPTRSRRTTSPPSSRLRRTAARRAAAASRRWARRSSATGPCSTRASRSPSTPPRASRWCVRAGGARGRGVPGRRPGAGRLRARSSSRLRRVVRGGRAQRRATRATRSTGSTSSTAPATCGSSSTARRWPSPARRTCCSSRRCRSATTCRARTSARTCCSRATRAPSAPTRVEASYLSTATAADVAWTYPEPLREAAEVTDRIAFFNERADLVIDGERLRAAGHALVARARGGSSPARTGSAQQRMGLGARRSGRTAAGRARRPR